MVCNLVAPGATHATTMTRMMKIRRRQMVARVAKAAKASKVARMPRDKKARKAGLMTLMMRTVIKTTEASACVIAIFGYFVFPFVSVCRTMRLRYRWTSRQQR